MTPPTLILLGGAPGVGKSAAADWLLRHTASCVWLDGDDLWNMNPFVVTPETIAVVEANVHAVLGNLLRGPWRVVLFTWVLHLPEIAERIEASLVETPHRTVPLSLVCSEQALTVRFCGDAERDEVTALALERLRQIRALDTPQIDTTHLSIAQVAAEIARVAGLDVPTYTGQQNSHNERCP